MIVGFFGFSAMAGWLVAVTLGALAVAAIAILAYEVRHAIDLPDNLDLEMMDEYPEDRFPEVHLISAQLPAGHALGVYARR
jgi:hypothetical protein